MELGARHVIRRKKRWYPSNGQRGYKTKRYRAVRREVTFGRHEKAAKENVPVAAVLVALLSVLTMTAAVLQLVVLHRNETRDIRNGSPNLTAAAGAVAAISRPVAESTPVPTALPTPTATPYAVDVNLYPELYVAAGVNDPRNNGGEKALFLTFDDGPCETTPKLLAMLDELGVKATFFVSGQYGTREEIVAQLKEIERRGHGIAVHSYSHDYEVIYASVEAFLADFKKMDDLIVEATGKRSSIYRFAGGSNAAFNERIREPLIQEMNRRGYVYHDWNASNGDAEGNTKAEQIKVTLAECRANKRSVILMHDTPDKEVVIETLPEIVNTLKKEGYHFERLDETIMPIQFVSGKSVTKGE